MRGGGRGEIDGLKSIYRQQQMFTLLMPLIQVVFGFQRKESEDLFVFSIYHSLHGQRLIYYYIVSNN